MERNKERDQEWFFFVFLFFAYVLYHDIIDIYGYLTNCFACVSWYAKRSLSRRSYSPFKSSLQKIATIPKVRGMSYHGRGMHHHAEGIYWPDLY